MRAGEAAEFDAGLRDPEVFRKRFGGACRRRGHHRPERRCAPADCLEDLDDQSLPVMKIMAQRRLRLLHCHGKLAQRRAAQVRRECKVRQRIEQRRALLVKVVVAGTGRSGHSPLPWGFVRRPGELATIIGPRYHYM